MDLKGWTDFIAEKVGTHKWCVAYHLGTKMKERYEVAISPRRYSELREEWDNLNYPDPDNDRPTKEKITMAKEIVISASPRMRLVKNIMSQTNAVRAYRSSPETVHLQIRLEKRYVGVDLPFADAIKLGQHLINEASGTSSPTESELERKHSADRVDGFDRDDREDILD